MGKCMNNSNRKTKRQVSNNNNTNSFTGVRTRARTVAIQNSILHDSSTSHLQLRRRLRLRLRLHRINIRPSLSLEANESQRHSEFDGQQRIRTTRDSTPSNAATATDMANVTKENPRLCLMSETNPTRQEIEDFFSAAECRQQQLCEDKYNFDFVNDKPLPGRFEWEKLIA